jgi:hypothetical protein
VFDDPAFVDPHDCRDGPCRAAEIAHRGAAKQQPRISASTALVDVDELRAQVRQLRETLAFERIEPCAEILNGGPAARNRLSCRPHALDLQLLLDLERAQLVQQSARLGREPIGFALQRTDSLVDLFGLCL